MDYEREREIEKCMNCSSENLIGPYDYIGAAIRIGIINEIRLKVYICVDCQHAMLFTRDKHKHKVLEEAKKER